MNIFFYETPQDCDETCADCGRPILPFTLAALMDDEDIRVYHLGCYETMVEEARSS